MFCKVTTPANKKQQAQMCTFNRGLDLFSVNTFWNTKRKCIEQFPLP